MFVRKNRNRSGSVSVQVIEKRGGAYRVVRTLGSARDERNIERLVEEGRRYIENPHGDRQPALLSVYSQSDSAVRTFAASLGNGDIRTIGPELIFGTIFDRMGFCAIPGELFRHLVVARLAYPGSKRRTIDYLVRYRGISLDEDAVYRFLDTLNEKHKEHAERISFAYTKQAQG